MIHNHPTGDSEPSYADIEITQKVKDACLAVNIRLHDHLIVGKYGHFSMRQKGLIK